jgi:y4mF family transcriptional regulator
MSLSEFVKEKRNQAGLTQPELADKAGVGLRFLRELEQGKETLRLDKVNQVLKLFGCELGPVDIKRDHIIKPETGNLTFTGFAPTINVTKKEKNAQGRNKNK